MVWADVEISKTLVGKSPNFESEIWVRLQEDGEYLKVLGRRFSILWCVEDPRSYLKTVWALSSQIEK